MCVLCGLPDGVEEVHCESETKVQAGEKRVNLMSKTGLSKLRDSCSSVHKLCRAKPAEKVRIFSRLIAFIHCSAFPFKNSILEVAS